LLTKRIAIADDCAALGIPRRAAHAFRRGHADWMLETGATLKEIRQSLRHADVITTSKYLSAAAPEHLRAAIERAAARHRSGDLSATVIPLVPKKR
jgi:integrase